MMQPEAQVLVREFNRRLRAAMSTAPNHVRMEAALEVESHVRDVLSRQKSDLSEAEQVAQILAGFGTPEEYARALISQLPGVQVADVRSGARDVFLAAGDLARGFWRLSVGLSRQFFTAGAAAIRWTAKQIHSGWQQARGPSRQALAWSHERGRKIRRGALVVRLWVGGHADDLGHVARKLWVVAGAGAKLLGRALRWSLRTVLLAALAALAVGSLALAGFAALAPDLVGWWVHLIEIEVGEAVDAMRQLFAVPLDPEVRVGFARTGETVLFGALGAAAVLVAVIVLMVWIARRHRSTATNA